MEEKNGARPALIPPMRSGVSGEEEAERLGGGVILVGVLGWFVCWCWWCWWWWWWWGVVALEKAG